MKILVPIGSFGTRLSSVLPDAQSDGAHIVQLGAAFIGVGVPEDCNRFCRLVEQLRIGNLCN